MIYPESLQQLDSPPYPILGKLSQEKHYFVDMSTKNHEITKLNLNDQKSFQEYLNKTYQGYKWGISGYLEFRETLLKDIPQMMNEKRYYHLGIDIITPEGTKLFAPIDSTVEHAGYEEDRGNYGGFVILKHEGNFESFYSLYGHLNSKMLPQKSTHIARGDCFANVGNFDCNGGWFTHTHMQIITKKGKSEGYFSKGYCSKDVLSQISTLCPSPFYLFPECKEYA
ncbi:MAG: peptidoglycan DD-metalloendopeptidase family protein [Kiritimatiellales bacterium]|nr:peptidoglycan DD-metalloendopeptidase family protein [Kiritimatiellales bacterium]